MIKRFYLLIMYKHRNRTVNVLKLTALGFTFLDYYIGHRKWMIDQSKETECKK